MASARLTSISVKFLSSASAFVAAVAVSVLALLAVGLVLPVLLMEQIYGPWSEQPVGSGLAVVLWVLFVAVPLSLFLLFMLSSRFYAKIIRALSARLTGREDR